MKLVVRTLLQIKSVNLADPVPEFHIIEWFAESGP